MSGPLTLGIDIGTSGVRIAALGEAAQVEHIAKADMDLSLGERNDPAVWHDALSRALDEMTASISLSRIMAICVDGTSGTVLALNSSSKPVGAALMYNDAVSDTAIPAIISKVAPKESAAHGAASALARSIELQKRAGVSRIVHQADWFAELLAGSPVSSDESNALKTGYDPISRQWPDWLPETGIDVQLLPNVVPTGSKTSVTSGAFGLPTGIPIVAGVSDGCASFLATGASEAGDAVTALGTTMTLKLLSNIPIFAPEYGIYSHRIGDRWLAGGASNSGGGVLLKFFSSNEMQALSRAIDPAKPSGLDYYPIPKPGERFPINDPDLPPRLTPRPQSDSTFLHGLFEGIARIEALGYRRLKELGGPELTSLRTVGGGAQNDVWSRMRGAMMDVPMKSAASGEAAVGTARIAWTYLENAS